VNVIAGEIDLSVGSVAALTGVVIVQLMNYMGAVPAIILAVALAICLGALQGFLIAVLRIQAIVFTIGSLVFLRGVSLLVAGNKTVALKDFDASDFVQTRLFVFSPASIAAISVLVLLGLFLKYHVYGREIFAIGGARNEALAAGVPLRRPMIIAFAISSMCAGVVGAILVLRSGSAVPLSLQELLLAGITAAFIGGVHVAGGKGSALGAALGAAVLTILGLGLNFFHAPGYVGGLVQGVFLIVILSVQMIGDRMGKRFLVTS
jgi:ribose/xylose/arabinose/galactoside ABC-type transport system permease subunit